MYSRFRQAAHVLCRRTGSASPEHAQRSDAVEYGLLKFFHPSVLFSWVVGSLACGWPTYARGLTHGSRDTPRDHRQTSIPP